jgi:hypothetical protein
MKVAILTLLGACTTLGPMPATTGIAAIPAGRPGLEAGGGSVPSFNLSTSAQDKSGGTHTNEFSLLFDPDRWFGVPGLILGARLFGTDKDTPGEPYVGYRRLLDENIAVAGVLFGSSKHSAKDGAKYHAQRLGGEAAVDVRLYSPKPWFGAHVQAAVSVTRIFASGTYCGDADGKAIACNMDPAQNTLVDGEMRGIFPAATGTFAIDFGRTPIGIFHSARLALMFAGGSMPLVRDGRKETTDFYTSGGLTLTLGVGAR